MRALKYIFLITAIAVVFAHSLSPHHHHTETVQKKKADHDHGHHHDHDQPKHHNSDDHSPFTFSQIDEDFLKTNSNLNSDISLPVMIAATWLNDLSIVDQPTQYFVKDIDIPPPIWRAGIQFRGPPSIS